MRLKRKQVFEEGAVFKIELGEDKLAFGRLVPGIAAVMCVYDCLISREDNIPAIEHIIDKPLLFYCGFFRDIIVKGVFEIIGVRKFDRDELFLFFKQDMVNIDECFIFDNMGGQRRVSPKECVGLEKSAVWDEKGIMQRISDHYAGKKNFHIELDKVILSKDDPRYLAAPNSLRWDFEKQSFYRI